jgi:nicotinate-nucleotide--dimethylbenzimidazole phosphoribosyltransferase
MGKVRGELEKILAGIRGTDQEWIEKARSRTAQLLMPHRALGRLHEISERICGIQRTLAPSVARKGFLVMAGDHGVVAEGVSAYPQVVTGEMVKTFLRGGAGINVLSRHVGAEVWVVDMGIATELDPASVSGAQKLRIHKVAAGTRNLAAGPAMSREQAEQAVLTGFRLATEMIEGGVQILGTGDMGIGNTTPSSAIAAAFTRRSLEEMVGRGTGVDEEGLRKKKEAVRRGLEINRPDPRDGLDVLAKVGGFEIGGIAGCVLAGAHCRRAVVIDGLISTAGAMVAHALCPRVTDYLFAGHVSEEPGHRAMLAHLGLDPILDLGMRLGEGTGAALAMGILEGAVKVFREMLTFGEAGVTGKA